MLESVHSEGAYAIIVSDAVEIVLFGVYTIFFAFALIILTVYKKPLPVDVGMVAATCVLYVACMAHCSAVTTDRHTAFTSGWPIPSGRDMSGLLRVIDVLFKTCALLSQLIMIHRCWAVWDYKPTVVLVPLSMTVAGSVCAMLGPSRLPTASFTSPFVAPRTPSLDLAAAVLALLVFALATVLLVLRLHRVSAPVRQMRSIEAVVWSLASACVEAGALLGVAQVAVVLLLAVGHPAVVVAEGVACQVYGIAPTLMVIRLGLSALPRRRGCGGRYGPDTTEPQFSTFLGTFYGPDELEAEAGAEDNVMTLPDLERAGSSVGSVGSTESGGGLKPA